ncbi:MAG: hypothetical protein H9855_11325 [Candidatus Acinetobacter avistercoris]|nr:hypothetical protein [Candidatus Acinetobacter avistercoris]
MLYVIPFVILLIIALLLKKRENAKDSNNTINNKKKSKAQLHHKNLTRSEKASRRVEEKPIIVENKTKKSGATLNDDDKAEIQQLIQTRRFLSAEAKINQALNQDSSQHDLYLFLFDIHLEQSDELATKQLLNHLRLLGLHDVIDQANQKLENAPWLKTSPSTPSITQNVINPSQADIEFNHLIEPKETTTFPQAAQNNAAFNETLSAFEFEKKSPQSDIEPLEFTLSDLTHDLSEPRLNQDHRDNKALDQSNTQSRTWQTDDIKPLEFSSDFPAQTHEKKTDFASSESLVSNELNFEKFEFEKIEVEKVNIENTNKNTNTELQDQSQLNLPQSNFELNSQTNQDYKFQLDTPIATTPEDLVFEEELQRSIQQTASQKIDQDSSEHIQDPLAQAFPQLLSTNEIQLNFELAQQYIQLGAYDAAKRLINDKADQYSAEQRHISEKLLNQIAS